MERSKTIPSSPPPSHPNPSDKNLSFPWIDKITKTSFSTLHSLGNWFYKNATPLAMGGIGLALVSRSIQILSFKDFSLSLQTLYKVSLLSLGLKSIEWGASSLFASKKEQITPSQNSKKKVMFNEMHSEDLYEKIQTVPAPPVNPLIAKQEALPTDPTTPPRKIIYRFAEAKSSRNRLKKETLETPLTKKEVLFNLLENPKSLSEIDPKFLDDYEIMLTAIKLDIKAFGMCSDRLKSDPAFLVKAGSIDLDIIRLLDPNKKINAQKQKELLNYIEKKKLGGVAIDTLKNALLVAEDSNRPPISRRKKSTFQRK